MTKLHLFVFALFAITLTNAQTKQTKATTVTTSTSLHVSPSLSSRTHLILAILDDDSEILDGRSSKNVIVPNKGNDDDDYLAKNPNRYSKKIKLKTPSLVFDASTSSSTPSDPSGAVGLNHYFAVFNTGFIIYDKLGNALTGQLSPDNIFSSGACCDLTASYDNAADKWVISILYHDGHVEVAVSQTNNPVTTTWNVYSFSGIDDYQKLSVWSDGYYMTANVGGGSGNAVFVLERDAMIAGNASALMVAFPLPGITTSGFYSPQAFNVSNNDLPAVGNTPIVYMQDDAWTGVSSDHLKIWKVNMDWVTTSNSTITSIPKEIVLTPFVSVFDNGSWNNLEQPSGGTSLDALQATVMNQAQFRKFSSHNSAVFNFVVDVDGSAEKQAGVRWIELRQNGDGSPWYLYQEGTYTSPNNKHAWNASLIMDSQGNIGMGYTGMGGDNSETLSVYYTGRYENDPLGTMSVTEELIAAGSGNIPSTRYGDYSKMDIDPSDDKTFWFIDEYFNGGRKDVVGVFKITADYNNDVGVISLDSPVSSTLSSSESVTVTIFNYGQNDASNFSVSYQIDGNTAITDTFTGTIASNTSAQHTFSTPANVGTVGQTYAFTCSTSMTGDEDNSNDSITTDVTNLIGLDIGVTAITSPVSSTSLTATEQVTITINNFGGESQSNFDVAYTVNGNQVTENIAGPIAPNTTLSYIFSQTADFSTLGAYEVVATTLLSGDTNSSNNSFTTNIIKSNCQPSMDCSSGDGLYLFQLGTINNTSSCDGYSDFTNLSTDLEINSTNDVTLTTKYGNQHVNIWIDFNDDFVFTIDELVVTDYILAVGSDNGEFTETTSLVVPTDATIGSHLMRAKTNWDSVVPDDACEETSFGETEDYMVNITYALGVDDFKNDFDFTVIDKNSNNIFEASLITNSFKDNMTITVYNTLGQQLVYYRMKNNNGSYQYTLDMSYTEKGIYLVRVGNNEYGQVKRIIVK